MEAAGLCLLPYAIPIACFYYDILRNTPNTVHSANGKCVFQSTSSLWVGIGTTAIFQLEQTLVLRRVFRRGNKEISVLNPDSFSEPQFQSWFLCQV